MKHFKNFINFTLSTLLVFIVVSANLVYCTKVDSKLEKNQDEYLLEKQSPQKPIPMNTGEPRPHSSHAAGNVLETNSSPHSAKITVFLPNALETKIFNSSTSLDTKVATDLEKLEELLNRVISNTNSIESQSTTIFKVVNATNITNNINHKEILSEFRSLQADVKDMQSYIKSIYGNQRESFYLSGRNSDFIDRMYYAVYSIDGIVLVILAILCIMFVMIRNLYRNQQRGIHSQILQVLQAMQNEAKHAPLVATVHGCANSAYRLGDPGLNIQCCCNAHG